MEDAPVLLAVWGVEGYSLNKETLNNTDEQTHSTSSLYVRCMRTSPFRLRKHRAEQAEAIAP